MVEMIKQGVTIVNGKTEFTTPANIDAARDKTMAYRILRALNTKDFILAIKENLDKLMA